MALLDVTLHARRAEARDVVSLELRPAAGQRLPAFAPGSHIDVEVPGPGGRPLLRQYSLCGDGSDTERYVIGVGRDAASRGGSAWLHDALTIGQPLRISAPRNNFPLQDSAAHSVLVAGGIGITPLLAMARRLSRLRRAWTLYYCVRTPCRAAFLEELGSLPGGKVVTVFDGQPGAARLDMAAVVREAPAGSHFYCCGPAPMLAAFQEATAACPGEHVHLEWFSAPTSAPADADGATGSYTVHLKRSGQTLAIAPGQNLLDALLASGADVDYSCREGLCGTCETRVLCGEPLHRDPLFSARKDAPQDRILPCVSCSRSPELTLDL